MSLTHTIVHPTIDQAKGRRAASGNDPVQLHKVAETEHGIVVRGARILATLAPFADETRRLSRRSAARSRRRARALVLHPDEHARAEDSSAATASRPTGLFDHPLSSRFDEQDAFVIFDDVEVPRDRVFIDANRDAYNTVMMTGWYPNIMQQTMIRAQTKLEFAYGLASGWPRRSMRFAAGQQMLGEIAMLRRARARRRFCAAEQSAYDTATACGSSNGGRSRRCARLLPTWFPRVNEIITLIGSHNLLATPIARCAGRSQTATAHRPLSGRRWRRCRAARAPLSSGVGLRRHGAGKPQ